MTEEAIIKVMRENAHQRIGVIGKQEFGVDQGPFEESDKKYVAYLIDNYNGDFYFDTIDEFLDGFIINGKPIGKQLDEISTFEVVLCDH